MQEGLSPNFLIKYEHCSLLMIFFPGTVAFASILSIWEALHDFLPILNIIFSLCCKLLI